MHTIESNTNCGGAAQNGETLNILNEMNNNISV